MTAVTERPLRADAARNAERIVWAARQIYGEVGPEAAIETIAQRAGVGERTLYRRFPTKAELVRAALDQCIAEDLTPTIEAARGAADPLQGLAQLIDAAIGLGARERNLLTAARRAGSLTPDISTDLYNALKDLVERGQRAGAVRADLVPADLPRLITMLHSVLWTMDSGSDGWRRYVALMLDAISAEDQRPLPPASTLRFAPETDSWPL